MMMIMVNQVMKEMIPHLIKLAFSHIIYRCDNYVCLRYKLQAFRQINVASYFQYSN
jgi:hypothetical protein